MAGRRPRAVLPVKAFSRRRPVVKPVKFILVTQPAVEAEPIITASGRADSGSYGAEALPTGGSGVEVSSAAVERPQSAATVVDGPAAMNVAAGRSWCRRRRGSGGSGGHRFVRHAEALVVLDRGAGSFPHGEAAPGRAAGAVASDTAEDAERRRAPDRAGPVSRL